MELNYLEYLDLCDALTMAMHRVRYYINTAEDKEERKDYEEREERYQALKKKIKHYAAENLY